MGFPDSSVGKKSACNEGAPGLISGLGRSAGERIGYPLQYSWASLVVQDSKESTCNVGVLGLIPGEGNGYPFQYSGLDNSMDRGAWQAIQFMGSHAKRQETDMTGQLSLFCANSVYLFEELLFWHNPLQALFSLQAASWRQSGKMNEVIEFQVYFLFQK